MLAFTAVHAMQKHGSNLSYNNNNNNNNNDLIAFPLSGYSMLQMNNKLSLIN